MLPPPTPISEVVEDAVNFVPHNVQARVSLLAARPIPERNSSCSYQNSTRAVPLQNGIQYTAGDRASVFPMATLTFQPYVPQPQTESLRVEVPRWDERICPNQSTVSYPYTINSYLPAEAQFHGQSYPWFGSNTVTNAQADLCQNDQYANWQ